MREPRDLIERLRLRASIRRQIPSRKSVQEGKPDRIAELLDEAADALERAEKREAHLLAAVKPCPKALIGD